MRPSSSFRLVSGLLLLASLGAAACRDTPTAPSTSAPFSYVDVRQGAGITALNGDLVGVYYVGWFYDSSRPEGKGAPFDSNRSAGRDVFRFTVGTTETIPGFNDGVLGMNVGGLRRIIVPPSKAYGGQRSRELPPFATLVFEVELVSVQ